MNEQNRIETLGPAERVIQTILTSAPVDHLYHGRPGIVTAAPGTVTGVKWEWATFKVEGGQKVAYFRRKGPRKQNLDVRAGVLGEDGKVHEGGRLVGEYRRPGLFPEVARWMYGQIAEVWKLDNEFAARWASHAFAEEHKDLKVALAAFMLVQNRCGEPVRENGEVLFRDEDHREVGEAMVLLTRNDKRHLDAKYLLRIRDLLSLPEVAGINRDLGFGRSAKNPALGRWSKAVEQWLLHRERNPRLLRGLVEKGYRTTVMRLARAVGYKPESDAFFQVLRWKQEQSADGRRTVAIGAAVSAAESWEGWTEEDICRRIVEKRPNFKRIVGLLPKEIGLTRAVAAAAVEAGCLSGNDLIILTPTLEQLGLLKVEAVKKKWDAATGRAENQRAANIAARVKSQEAKEGLAKATDNAVRKAVEEVIRGLTIYVFVDISGSMQPAIEVAKTYVAKLLGGIPINKLHVAVFNTSGRRLAIQHVSRVGVDAAFRGIAAGGGTDYGAGIRALQAVKPDLGDDALFIFVGDEQHPGTFEDAVRASGITPRAFGLLKVGGTDRDRGVRDTAIRLGIPCFPISDAIFNDNPEAIPRTLRALIAATPVGRTAAAPAPSVRVTLVERILKTDLLRKPLWTAEVPA